MAMNGQQMAAEVLAAMGGEQTPERVAAFQRMCEAIVAHMNKNAQVTVTGVQLGGGTVITPPGSVQ